MSRVGDGEGDESFPNEWAFWHRRYQRVMAGKPGLAAFRELREALLALPEKRLISRALSTAGKPREVLAPGRTWSDHNDVLDEQGEGVCAVGAFAWHQRVKAGADPVQAMADLPLALDYDDGASTTAEVGMAAGLSETLAWVFMQHNDDDLAGLTPEARYEAYLAWVERKIETWPVAGSHTHG